jgi:hypothetical protein
MLNRANRQQMVHFGAHAQHELAAILLPGNGMWESGTLPAVRFHPILHDIASLVVNRCFIVPMAARANQWGRASNKAAVLCRPFHDFDVMIVGDGFHFDASAIFVRTSFS